MKLYGNSARRYEHEIQMVWTGQGHRSGPTSQSLKGIGHRAAEIGDGNSSRGSRHRVIGTKSVQSLTKLKRVALKRVDPPQNHKKQSRHLQTQTQRPLATMSLSWRRPAHPAPTLIGSSIPEAEKRAICTMQADVIVFMIKRFGIPDKNGFADYLRDRIRSIDADRDVDKLNSIYQTAKKYDDTLYNSLAEG